MSIRNRITQYLSSVLSSRIWFTTGPRLVGKSAVGAGYGGEITVGTGLTLSGGVLSASGGEVSDIAYNEATWNGVTTIAPSKNAVRDKFESLVAPTALAFAGIDPNGEPILAARIVGGAYDGLILREQGTSYGNGKVLFGLDYVSYPVTFINWGSSTYSFNYNTSGVGSSAAAIGTDYPWEADWTGSGFTVVEDEVVVGGVPNPPAIVTGPPTPAPATPPVIFTP